MVPPNPSAEGSGPSRPREQPPVPAGHTAGAGGVAGVGDGGHIAPPPGKPLHHPAVLEQEQQRVHNFQLRVADWITAFAGSMTFVYIHVVLFTVWMLFIERKPWPTLTLIVSLEAIFLSTFVMIGQNRQAAFQQAKADHDFTEQELELKTNTQLTREIYVLTAELNKRFAELPGPRQS